MSKINSRKRKNMIKTLIT